MNYDYVLDSFAWMELFLGTEKGKIVGELIDKKDVAIPIIALAELSDKFDREHQNFEPSFLFIQQKATILPLTIDIALKAGKLKNELRKIARNISLADCLGLQIAKSVGATFVTGDPDFKDVKGVMFL
ncbi:MAG: PIN domain-containing protein [Nanoarchaeota archaeon]